jgi:pyruvate kinase
MMIFTNSWFMAKTASSFRPNLPVFTFTYTDSLIKKLAILFWLKTFLIEKQSSEKNLENAIKILKEKKLVNIWDEIVTVYWIKRDNEVIPSIQVITIK